MPHIPPERTNLNQVISPMNEETNPRILNHYSLVAFKDQLWSMTREERTQFLTSWTTALSAAAQKVEFYQSTESGLDAVIWSAAEANEPSAAATFFDCLARAANSFRGYIEQKESLWGFTRPSQYSKARSKQEIDPFDPFRKPYLVIYPFVKTTSWYLLSRDARQGIMNEHIRIGKQYEEISQLLLYSTGVQDQEFVVVYEMDDLARFSDLVSELRSTDGRVYTLRDTPLHTTIYHTPENFIKLWT
jgi:chlorite dismutase